MTLWEILTFARELPYEALSDEEVVENLSELSDEESLPEMLGQPYNCPRDVFELMLECWAKHRDDRPDFQVWRQLSPQLSTPLNLSLFVGNFSLPDEEKSRIQPGLCGLRLLSQIFEIQLEIFVYLWKLPHEFNYIILLLHS